MQKGHSERATKQIWRVEREENIKSGSVILERQTDRQTETEKQRQREDKIILYYTEDKDLSTSRLFYKSDPDDKHSNTQYSIRQTIQIIAAN